MGVIDGILNAFRIEDRVEKAPQAQRSYEGIPQMVRCKYCNAEIREGTKFCTQCGKNQFVYTPKKAEKAQSQAQDATAQKSAAIVPPNTEVAAQEYKRSDYMTDAELERFAKECNQYAEKASSDSKKIDAKKEKKYEIKLNRKDDDILDSLIPQDLSDSEGMYLSYIIFETLSEKEHMDLYLPGDYYTGPALKLLIDKKHLNEKMISYAFDLKMIASFVFYSYLHETLNYIDDYGNINPEKMDEIKEKIEQSSSNSVFLNKAEKQIIDRLSKCDIDSISSAAESYMKEHPDAFMPSNIKLNLKYKDDSKLDTLYYENLTDREKEYLDQLILNGEGVDDFSLLYDSAPFVFELAKAKGKVNTKMISYAFDIDMLTAYRMLDHMISDRKVIKEDGTLNHDMQFEIDFLTDALEDGVYTNRRTKENIDSLPKCNFEKFSSDVKKYYAQEIESSSQDDISKLASDSNSEDLSTSEKGIAFEEYCASLLKLKGYTSVKMTETTGDHGIDILAEKDDISYAIQCKYYSGSVGNSAVQEAFSGKAFYGRDIAVVMTNSTFTTQAMEEAKRIGVKLWDGEKIKDMFG